MKLGILETGDVAEPLRTRYGDYPAMFTRLLAPVDPGLAFSTVHVTAGEMPGDPRDADAWLVTGSRHGVYDGLPWIAPLEDFLRACLKARVPVVGICFGHQILAQAMGGRAEKSDSGWQLGVKDYTILSKPAWMADAPDAVPVGTLHQDQVTVAPPGTMLLARGPDCPIAALAYGDPEAPDAISLQPHPEFDAPFLDALLALRSGAPIPAEAAEAGRASLARPMARADWGRWIAAYLRRTAAA